MLIVPLKKGEKLYIGRDITIALLETTKHKVKIGIDAPPESAIWRDGLDRYEPDVESEEPEKKSQD